MSPHLPPRLSHTLALAGLVLSTLASPARAVQLEVRYEGVLIPHGGTHDFGEVFVGTQPVYHLTVKNVDTTSVFISGSSITSQSGDPGHFSYFYSDLGVLAPGDVGSYDIQFHADGLGAVTNEVEFAVSGVPRWNFYVSATTVEPPDLALGEGLTPIPIPYGATYGFGTVFHNQDKVVAFAVTNNGGSDLHVSTIEWDGDRIALVSSPPASIPAGETAYFQLRLKTDIPGSYTSQVRIFSDDPSPAPYLFYPAWEVSEEVGPILRIQLGAMVIGNEQTVSFGTTGVGTTVSRTFTAYNDGDQPMSLMLPIGQYVNAPGTFEITENNATSLPPGGSGTFRVDYHATALGTSTAWITPLISGSPIPFEFFVTCTAAPPDFSVDVSPASRTVAPGQNATYTVATEALYGFSGTLSLAVSGLPSGTSATLTPSSVAAGETSELRISTSASTPPANKIFTVTGTNGADSRSDTARIRIQNPEDFTLDVTPDSRTLVPGGQTSYTVAVDPVNGFDSSVSLSLSGLPAGASYQFAPSAVTPAGSSLLTVTTATTSPIGDHPLTVSGTGGGRTHSDQVVLHLVPPGGAPQVDSVTPDQFSTGQVTRITIQGQNLQGAAVSIATTPAEPGDPLPAVFPDVSLVSVSGDGRTLQVDVDATAPGVSGFYNLVIDTAGGEAGAPFRVVGGGPEVDVWTPREPARGRTYSLSMLGVNLSGATISVSGGGGVTAYVVVTGPGALSGVLDVAASAPTGPRTLVVHRGSYQTQVPINVVASLEASNLAVIDVTAEAAQEAAAVGELVPEILLQEFSLRDDLAWTGDGGNQATEGVCTIVLGWQIYHYAFTVALPFDPGTGQVLFDILRQMQLGIPVPVGIRILSGFADLLLQIQYNCFPVSHIEICLFGNIGFEIPGLGGQIFAAGGCFFGGIFFPVATTTGVVSSFQFHTDNQCSTVVPLTPPTAGGEQVAEVTLNQCCTEHLRIDAHGHSFTGTIYQFPFGGDNVPVAEITPDPDECNCAASVHLDPVALAPGQTRNFKARIKNNCSISCAYNWSLIQIPGIGPELTLDPNTGAVILPPDEMTEITIHVSIPSQVNSVRSPNLQMTVVPAGSTNQYLGLREVCVLPTTEASMFHDFPHPIWDEAIFFAQVAPTSVDWSNLGVTEGPIGSGTGTYDNCHYPGSPIPEVTDMNSISGEEPTPLTSSGLYQDLIGFEDNLNLYYPPPGEAFCDIGTTQHMKRVCTDYPLDQEPEYKANQILFVVDPLATVICRDGACAPPH